MHEGRVRAGTAARRRRIAKPLLWSVFLSLIAASCAAVIFAPSLGLGEQYDFILYRTIGMPRSLALQLLLWPLTILLCYEILGIGIKTPADRSRVVAVVKSAWNDGCVMARNLTNLPQATVTRREIGIVIALIAALAATFAIFLFRSLVWFKFPLDQHWWQAMVDYGIDWGAPVLSFGGNLLYGFGIQVPLKGQLLPMEGAAHWFPIQLRIVAMVVIYFLSTAILFCCIGAAIGLKVIYRTAFAGLVALLMTIPVGLDHVLWLLPPRFFTHQFTLALWWGEAPILMLTAAFLFLLLGRRESMLGNLCAGAVFAIGALAVVLSYPVGSVFFVPLLALYCLGLIVTCESRREFLWKGAVSALLAAFMLIARVPQFLRDLYSYSFGAYFFEFSPDAPPSLKSNFLFASHIDDPRGLFVFAIAFAALTVAARNANGTLRRIAIAALVCECGIIVVTTINSWVWQVPLAGAYAELGHAPLWGSFFVLSLIIFAKLLDQRLVHWANSSKEIFSLRLARVIDRRHWIYGFFFALALAGYWLFRTPMSHFSDYPPGRPPSVDLLAQELALAPGTPFRGRVMTLVSPKLLNAPSDLTNLWEVVDDRYRRYLGNDHYLDLAALNIPTVNEYGYWASPPTFTFLRIFFGQEHEIFGRAWFVLSRFDMRIARLIGVRMVVTDASSIPGGVLVYETTAGDTDLRVFRIDEVNVGQYSPTRVRRVGTATEAIAAIKATDFDPKRDVVVETEIPTDLLPATSVQVNVDRGPKLVVRATSPGRSLLVLPFDYSRCLRIKTTSGSAQLVPVNLQQTGFLFEDRVEAEITYRFGLFQGSHCRGEDHRRADDLRLKEALVTNNRATLVKRRPTLW